MGYKINKKNFKDAVIGTGAILNDIARKLKVTRLAIYNFIKKHPEYCRPLLEQEAETVTDDAEGGLYKQIKNNEAWAIKYYLSTKGKGRGYTEKTEFEHSGTVSPVTIVIKELEDKVEDVDKTV